MHPEAYSRIPLYDRQGRTVDHALVDDDDHAALSAFRWFRNNNGYALRSAPGGPILMHRQILGLTRGDGLECDHINRDKLDNRRCNLRAITHAQNNQNVAAQRRGASVFRAVFQDTGKGKWRARPAVNGVQHHLGFFVDDYDAAAAVDQFLREHVPFSTPDPEFIRATEERRRAA